MLSLEMAVEFVNGDGRKSAHYTTEDIIKIAREFEAYLTEKPHAGYVPPVDDP